MFGQLHLTINLTPSSPIFEDSTLSDIYVHMPNLYKLGMYALTSSFIPLVPIKLSYNSKYIYLSIIPASWASSSMKISGYPCHWSCNCLSINLQILIFSYWRLVHSRYWSTSFQSSTSYSNINETATHA